MSSVAGGSCSLNGLRHRTSKRGHARHRARRSRSHPTRPHIRVATGRAGMTPRLEVAPPTNGLSRPSPLRWCRIRPRADGLPGGVGRQRRGRLRPGVQVGPLRLVDVGAEAHPVPTRVRRRRSPLGVALEHRRQVLDRAPDHRPRGGVRQVGIELGLLGLRPPLRLVEEAVVADAIAAQVDRVSGPARRARRVGRLPVPRVAREHRADGPPRGVPLVRDPLVGGIVAGPPLRLVDGPLPDDLLPRHVHAPAAPDGVRARLRVVSGPPIGLRQPLGWRGPDLGRPVERSEKRARELERVLLHPAARRQHLPVATVLRAALRVAVRRPDGDPTETDLVGEVRQGGRVLEREDLALDVVATDHRRGAEPRPELLGAQPKAGPPIGGGQLRVGGAQRALRRLAHADVVRLARAEVHRHEVDAGEIHPRPEHLRRRGRPRSRAAPSE